MLPIDLRFVQQQASQALGFLAEALGDETPSHLRSLLLNAMNAVDDIEATIESAFDMAAVIYDNDPSLHDSEVPYATDRELVLTLVA